MQACEQLLHRAGRETRVLGRSVDGESFPAARLPVGEYAHVVTIDGRLHKILRTQRRRVGIRVKDLGFRWRGVRANPARQMDGGRNKTAEKKEERNGTK